MNAVKIFLICLLSLITSIINAQEVSQPKYEKAINYIIYQITETSLEDNGKKYLADFKKINEDRSFSFERLVEFLKTREDGVLTSNLELVYNINGYKEKYDEHISASEYYNLLSENLIQEPYIQNFKLNHQTSFPSFEENIIEYLTYLFDLKETSIEVIEDGLGEVVMGETESSNLDDRTNNSTETTVKNLPKVVITTPTVTEEKPSIKQPENPIFDDYSPFKSEDGEPIFSLSSWLFRISLLCIAMAVLLYVLLPYYEKREKSKVKKPGGEIHPSVLALEAELNLVENNNRIMREKVRKLHLDLDDFEDTFKTY